MENRGVLTADDRAFFEGEKTTNDPDKTRREKRFNINERIDHIDEDIKILREAGEDDVVQRLQAILNRYERLERQVQDLQQQIDELKNS
jgi:archaellum component FlaC